MHPLHASFFACSLDFLSAFIFSPSIRCRSKDDCTPFRRRCASWAQTRPVGRWSHPQVQHYLRKKSFQHDYASLFPELCFWWPGSQRGTWSWMQIVARKRKHGGNPRGLLEISTRILKERWQHTEDIGHKTAVWTRCRSGFRLRSEVCMFLTLAAIRLFLSEVAFFSNFQLLLIKSEFYMIRGKLAYFENGRLTSGAFLIIWDICRPFLQKASAWPLSGAVMIWSTTASRDSLSLIWIWNRSFRSSREWIKLVLLQDTSRTVQHKLTQFLIHVLLHLFQVPYLSPTGLLHPSLSCLYVPRR